MNSKILNTIANVIDNKDEIKKRSEFGKQLLEELKSSVNNCQNRFAGKSELATEDDIRIINLCEKWEKILSHGIKTNLSNSAIQQLVTAGLNFTFNIVNIGNTIWSYTCLHLTKHEQERFKILSNISTPLGYFRAFLRAALNERSLERYLYSWIGNGLLPEYYEEGSLLRDQDCARQLPGLANGLSSVLFALSIDRAELNESLQNSVVNKAEHVIPLPTPIKPNNNLKRKPLRQVISFDKVEQKNDNQVSNKSQVLKTVEQMEESTWNSAPPTCLSSPDPKVVAHTSASEPTSSEYKSSLRYFFPDSVRAIESPSQILTKLSERAKEIFSSSHSIDLNPFKDEADLSVKNLTISESDSEEVAGSIDGSTSCLELCFTEDEATPDERALHSVLEKREKDYLALQLKCNQIELTSKDKIQKLEKVVLDLSKENDRLKEQLRQYMSAIEIAKAIKSGENSSEEVTQYEKKLVQVAEMHAELMEFNQHLQRRVAELEGGAAAVAAATPRSNVQACLPTAFLVGKRARTYHVYQVFLKIGQEEWNVYHRYAKFYELHTQLKKLHPDIANYKFPPKKTIGKRSAVVVEARRVSLQAYLRLVLSALPELRDCTSRAQLVVALPFFGISSTCRENGTLQPTLGRQISIDSVSSFAPL